MWLQVCNSDIFLIIVLFFRKQFYKKTFANLSFYEEEEKFPTPGITENTTVRPGLKE